MRLLVNYCYSLYGCCLWNITNPAVESVCTATAWQAGVRRVWCLPSTTHCSLLPLITSRLPIMDEIVKRVVASCKSVCWATASLLVSLRVMPFGLDGCHLLSVPMFTTVSLGVGRTLTAFCFLHLLPLTSVFGVPSPNDVDRAILLVELLLLRSGVLTFSSSGFSSKEVNSIVENVACYWFFLLFLLFLLSLFMFVLRVRFHNKINK